MKTKRNKFSLRLKELRTKNRISQTRLANDLGVSQSSICLWEKGDREPNVNMLLYLSYYFNVSTDYLIGLKDF